MAVVSALVRELYYNILVDDEVWERWNAVNGDSSLSMTTVNVAALWVLEELCVPSNCGLYRLPGGRQNGYMDSTMRNYAEFRKKRFAPFGALVAWKRYDMGKLLKLRGFEPSTVFCRFGLCDFFLFPNLKKSFVGQKFGLNTEAITPTETFFVDHQ